MVLVGSGNLKELRKSAFKVEMAAKLSCTGMKLIVLTEKRLRSNVFWIKTMIQNNKQYLFVLYLENKDCDDLENEKFIQSYPTMTQKKKDI